MHNTVNSLITDNIDLWTSAIKKRNATGRGSNKKIELSGIKKLRELILELAVRGKLVPQDANDEPASVLLKRIAKEKAQLITDKKIKKQKPLPAITDVEIPFVLPNGWEWLRLGNAGTGSTGKTPSTRNADFFGGNIQFIGPGNITPKGQLLEADKFLTELGVEQSTSAIAGDLLMVCIGGSIGKSALAIKHVAFNQQINAMQPIEVSSEFLKHTVSTHIFYNSVIEKSTGSATPIINRGKWEELLIPIAPLAEQHRIVAKVDELMLLCDQLEQQTEQSLSAHQTLVEVLLATLTDSDSAVPVKESFQTNWQRLAEHFDVLFTTEASIEQLKQTILQLAVMGKLVPQNPDDEPASVLLEKITKEKAQLIADKKIKKQKPLPAITDDEAKFDVPTGWAWCKFGLVAEFINGDRGKNYPNKSEYVDDGVPWINTGHIEPSGSLTATNMNYITKAKYNSLRGGKVQEGDLVYCLRGATFGKTAFVEPYNCGAIASSLMIIRPYELEFNSYIYKYLTSPFGRSQIFRFDNGSAQPNLSANSVMIYAFPLPPLPEQHRIVAKVDELMTLCDQLKAQLNNAQTTQLHLADAVVNNALKTAVG